MTRADGSPLRELPGTEKTIPCEMLIVAAGFMGPRAELAQAFGVDTTDRTNIATQGYATSVAKVLRLRRLPHRPVPGGQGHGGRPGLRRRGGRRLS